MVFILATKWILCSLCAPLLCALMARAVFEGFRKITRKNMGNSHRCAICVFRGMEHHRRCGRQVNDRFSRLIRFSPFASHSKFSHWSSEESNDSRDGNDAVCICHSEIQMRVKKEKKKSEKMKIFDRFFFSHDDSRRFIAEHSKSCQRATRDRRINSKHENRPKLSHFATAIAAYPAAESWVVTVEEETKSNDSEFEWKLFLTQNERKRKKFGYQEISVWGVWRWWWRHYWIQQREKSDQRFRQVEVECFELARYEHNERGRNLIYLIRQMTTTRSIDDIELISRCFLQILISISIRRQLLCVSEENERMKEISYHFFPDSLFSLN